jgi:D-galactarolactone cycloisomerase
MREGIPMEITDVRVTNLRYEYPDGGFLCAEGKANARVTSLVTVTLDNGLTGIGSAYSHPDLVRIIVEEQFAPLLRGDDPRETDRLWNFMYSLTRWYGRGGAAISALGAVDMALWDLRGKLADRPVYELLGGSDRHVEAYASALLWQDDVALVADEAVRHKQNGFANMKMRCGRDDAYDTAAVEAVIAAIGPDARLAVDGTHAYQPAQAERFAALLSDRNVLWFEEPFPPEDVAAYADLRRKTDVPIAAGENEYGLRGFQDLIQSEAIDIAQPDVSRAGGITECRRIAQLAETAGLRITTHTWNDAVTVLASAHLIAASPNGWMIEVDGTGNPFIDRLTTRPLVISEGRLELPDAPGLGIELDEEAVAKYRVPDDQHIREGNYADMIFGKAHLRESAPERARVG